MKTRIGYLALLALGSARADTAITMYNQGFGVVREVLPMELKAGENLISFDRATAQVQPDSVIFRDVSRKAGFRILEQNYRNDPVSELMMLKYFEGKEVSFFGYNDGSEHREVYPVKIVRAGEGNDLLLEIKGQLMFGKPSGDFQFPSLAGDSILRPTLTWKIAAEKAEKFDAQVSYMTGGFSWQADYNLVAPEKGEMLNVTGWVTLRNQTGASFSRAKVKLLAGDVNVVLPMMSRGARGGHVESLMLEKADAPVKEKAFDDFHLYTLPRELDLKNEETKQVEFLRSAKVQAKKTYLFETGRGGNQVEVAWEFENTEENGLGVPLPAGKMRVYREDAEDGNLEFVGENQLKHTPQKEKVRLVTGNAFDLVGAYRRVESTSDDSRKVATFTDEVTLTNRSKEEKTVLVRGNLWLPGDVKVTKCDVEYQMADARTVEFAVTLKPDEKRKVRYSARSEW